MIRKRKTYKFSQADLDKLMTSFESMDDNKDGVLSRKEVKVFAKQNGLEGNFVKLLFLLFDKDKNDTLSFQEFLDYIAVMRLSEEDPKIFYRRVFNAIDTNKGGSLDKDELVTFCDYLDNPITPAEAVALIQKYDRAGTKTLTFNEVCHWLEN